MSGPGFGAFPVTMGLRAPRWRAFSRGQAIRARFSRTFGARTPVAKQRRAKPTASRRRDKKMGGGGRRKPCPYCKDKIEQVDYKDVVGLRRFVSERGKIRSRRITGACRRHQSQIATAVKRARELALLPYAAEPTREEGPRGRSRDDRDRDRDRDR